MQGTRDGTRCPLLPLAAREQSLGGGSRVQHCAGRVLSVAHDAAGEGQMLGGLQNVCMPIPGSVALQSLASLPDLSGGGELKISLHTFLDPVCGDK